MLLLLNISLGSRGCVVVLWITDIMLGEIHSGISGSKGTGNLHRRSIVFEGAVILMTAEQRKE